MAPRGYEPDGGARARVYFAMMYRLAVSVFLACVWLRLWTSAAAGGGGTFVRMDTARGEYDAFIDGWEAT